jgi:hypothetical protein
VITRNQDKMFFQLKASELSPDSQYEVSVFSVRTDSSGKKIIGKNSVHTFFVGNNKNSFNDEVYSTLILTTTDQPYSAIATPSGIKIVAYAKQATASWNDIVTAQIYRVQLNDKNTLTNLGETKQ